MAEKPKLEVLPGGDQKPDIEPETPPVRRIDFSYMQSLGHIAGNPFYERPEPPDEAA